MTAYFPAFGSVALAASTVLALGLASPIAAAPGKEGQGRHMAADGCRAMAGHGTFRRLTVTGQGESRVAPDMATVQLGVTTQAETAAEAMRQNSTQQAAVIEAVKAAGVSDTDIQTSGLNLNPVMDYGDGRAPRVTGYQASNMVGVRVVEMGRLGEVLDAIVAAGANEINGISFGRDDGADAEDEARRAAVADARHKAGVLAEAAGLRLGPVLLLHDSPAPDMPRPMMRMAADAAGAAESVPVEAGELSLSATVQMEYALLGGMEGCREGARPGRGGHDRGEDAGDAGGMEPASDDAAMPEDQASPDDQPATEDQPEPGPQDGSDRQEDEQDSTQAPGTDESPAN